MSPILKRDISETLRQARRLAVAATGGSSRQDEQYDQYDQYERIQGSSGGWKTVRDDGDVWTSGSDRRRGIGTDEQGEDGDGDVGWGSHSDHHDDDYGAQNGNGGRSLSKEECEGIEEVGEEVAMLSPVENASVFEEDDRDPQSSRRIGGFTYDEGLGVHDTTSKEDGRLRDLRNLLLEATPSLLLSLIGLVFTGELLEHLARWRVFRRVDELFILVPMIGNLKGNLEMCLSARLGTSANIGEIDHRLTRRALLTANMTLLGLQALLISSLAAFLSFVLGLLTIHRLGDSPVNGVIGHNSTVTGVLDPGLAVDEIEWQEGYTRPGWKQLVMVLATGMGAAGCSSAILGSFMTSLIVVSRWAGLDPDNITPPLAACLGDLLTLFILALLGTALVGTMDTPVPLIAVICMTIAAGWFTRRVMRNQWVKKVARGGWIPLIGAMLISSGTGMVLDRGVGKYRGFALLAISMTGLTGSIGAIHANRLSTVLHSTLQQSANHHQVARPTGMSPIQSIITLYLMSFPCQACFVLFVSWAGWIDLSLGWAGWATFAIITAVSLCLAHFMTLFFWSKDLDPDSYTLPLHSALVDFLGQLFLMAAYEICIIEGRDVLVKDILPPLH